MNAHNLPCIGAKTLVEKVFPKPAWLIEPFLSRGSDWLIAGEPNSYKSVFLLQMLIHASLGLDYLFLRIDTPLKIVYITMDENERMVQERLQHFVPKGQTLNDNLLICPQPAILLDHAGRQQVETLVYETKPDIVVLDHLTSLVEGGTTDQAGMQNYNLLQKKLCSQDMGVLSVTHFSRSSKDNANDSLSRRIAGCSQIIGVHNVISTQECLSKHITDKYEQVQFTLVRHKGMKQKELDKYARQLEVVENGEKTFLRER